MGERIGRDHHRSHTHRRTEIGGDLRQQRIGDADLSLTGKTRYRKEDDRPGWGLVGVRRGEDGHEIADALVAGSVKNAGWQTLTGWSTGGFLGAATQNRNDNDR